MCKCTSPTPFFHLCKQLQPITYNLRNARTQGKRRVIQVRKMFWNTQKAGGELREGCAVGGQQPDSAQPDAGAGLAAGKEGAQIKCLL